MNGTGLAIRRCARPTLSALALTFGFVRLLQQLDLITVHFDRMQAIAWRVVQSSYHFYNKLLQASHLTDAASPENAGYFGDHPSIRDEREISLLKAYLTSIPFACFVGGFLMTWIF